ncbi:proton-dependent oligopeptide transporter, POT family [Singulisphaera sp. GP187]|uniref:peptide MFS transporter n=1 Tax=Singulisphaera sp. GP187 TaxID=1882752 RepID=UPI0009279767|nr:peptide MFS transporter [Singulisphaera sp. GP187]SIN93044.1 proton-dependent oligopeptide transporter, POT family [Singulisphaera sp. GP187]
MTTTADFGATVGAAKRGHPTGLYVLFGAEMWERFSYYGMRALLVLYLTKHLHFEENDALTVYGTYTGLVYLTPLLGGYLADRFLGQRKAILIGGSLMALGHFAMAIESLLTLALGLIILGNGFFKPNISTMVGQLYPQNDPRRDGAYTIFYMGINLGAFFAPLVCGSLGESKTFGWHYGFAAAGVGMILGLITFTVKQRALGTTGYPPNRSVSGEDRLVAIDWVHVAVLTLVGAGLVYLAILPAKAIEHSIPSRGWWLVLGYWIMLAFAMIGLTGLITRQRRSGPPAPENDAERADLPAQGSGRVAEVIRPTEPFTSVDIQRVLVIVIVALFSILFWMGFEQAGGTFTLFADKKTARVILGNPFPASWYQSINPLLIFILAPLFSILWTTLDRTKLALGATAKMGFGLIFLGLGFVVMSKADQRAVGGSLVGPQWLAFVYALNTLGELCLSPIGLSLVNKLAPARIASLMMAVWFLCTAVANYLAGMLHQWIEQTDVNLWTFLIYTSIIPGIILLALTPVLKRMGHGRI